MTCVIRRFGVANSTRRVSNSSGPSRILLKAQAMPWTEPLADSNELRRCIRDLVALSTLPAGWQNCDMRQIGSSIVAALISMLNADFVFIALPGEGDQLIAEVARSNLALESLNHVRIMLQRENATLSNGQ